MELFPELDPPLRTTIGMVTLLDSGSHKAPKGRPLPKKSEQKGVDRMR